MTRSTAPDSILAGLPPFPEDAPPTADGLILLGLAQLDLYECSC